MLLWSFHIVAIAILVAVVGSIAFQMGKKEGIRMTEVHYAEQLAGQQTSQENKQENPTQNSTPAS